MTYDIWILLDNRTGNDNQAIALAEEIGLGYEIKNIKYNFFGKLPNFLFKFNPFHINKTILNSLDFNKLPKIIISSGRRTAPLALYLKKKSNNNLKIVQIMKPNTATSEFDLVIIPQHDNIREISPNIIKIIGALCNIKLKLEIGGEELYKHYPDIKNFIAVVIGGDTKKYKFTTSIAELFSEILTKISLNHASPFFISFSRRTPRAVKEIIKKHFPWPHAIYDPDQDGYNPYIGMLSKADYIITTADSISICSEVASTGKPLYIFCPNKFKLKKHRFFIQQLIDLGIARKIEESTNFLETYSYKPLYEVKKVAEIIKKDLLQL